MLKHFTFTKKQLFIFLMIGILYFVIRIPNITLQPIFADEAIYIRWAQVMRSEPTLRFLPLSDGKTPFFMWVMIPLFKIFQDPLLAGRMLSVFSGALTLVGVFLLARLIFNSKTALWAAFIYAILPYMVFFDRMALVDSMLSAFTIWCLFIATLLLKFQRLDLSMILGYLLGIGILVKTPAMVNLLVLPLTIIGFDFKKSKKADLVKLALYWILAGLITLIIYNILRLGPGFNQLSKRNNDYIFSPSELISRPLDPFIPHIKDLFDMFPVLISPPVILAFFVGLYFVIKRKDRVALAAVVWAVVPLLILMVFLKTLTARYLLFTIPPLLIIAAFGIDNLIDLVMGKFKDLNQKVLLTVITLLVVASFPLYFDYLLITSPQNAPLPKNERRGYLEDWTAGYGFKELSQFLIEENKKKPVVVGVEGYFGTLPEGLQIYLDKANIPIIGGGATISAQLREAAKDNRTFYVGNKSRLGANNQPNAKLIKEYLKALPRENYPQDSILVYEVFPDNNPSKK